MAIGLRVKDVADRLGMTERQVRSRIEAGALRYRRSGKYVLVHPADVDDLESSMWVRREPARARQSIPSAAAVSTPDHPTHAAAGGISTTTATNARTGKRTA